MVGSAIDTLNIPVILGTIIFGAGVIVAYLYFSLRKTSTSRETKHETVAQRPEKKKEVTITGKSKAKKAPENKWIPKSEKQAYSHPWLLTSIKGHTGPILDIDFSSNGKYLASCADEDPDPGDITSASASSSESNKSDTSESVVSSGKSNKGLSRRQRKNRRREDISQEKSEQKSPKVSNNNKTPITVSKKKVTLSAPLGQYLKFERLNATEKIFTNMLENYLLSYEAMIKLGYPVTIDDQEVVVCKTTNVKKILTKNRVNSTTVYHYTNTIPKVSHLENELYDSGQGSSSSSSSSSSDSGEFLDSEESSSENSSDHDEDNTSEFLVPGGTNFHKRICCRCRSLFLTSDNQYVKSSDPKTKCKYHWGKLQLLSSLDDPKLVSKMFTCCRGKPHSPGCTDAPVHVWDGLEPGMNIMQNFVFTKPRKTFPKDGNYGVYAVDCEMSYTVKGLELTKVTVVGVDGRLVYDSFVKPDNEIVDYNTRFSGVSAKDLKKNNVKNLKEVQNDLMGFINFHTILVGHGLENDLRALKIVHYRVVDTSHSFPHPKGLPYRWSLKNLTYSILKRNIQCHSDGHNSYEDAASCMELVLWLVNEEYKYNLQHPPPIPVQY